MWSARPFPAAWWNRLALLLAVSLVVLFFVLNRGAYQSFFQDDEFDTLAWAPYVPMREWLTSLVTPLISPKNFRPVGHAYYLLEDLAGFHFAPYIAVLQILHLLNSVLIWRICRKSGVGPVASVAGAGFFLLNMAAIYAYWKPMNSFDMLCTTFSLASILLWAHGRWVWSFVAFWLAYKAKEPAVMLPVALALYQLWLDKRRNWWKLLPFFAVSLSFGLQAVLANRGRHDDYQLRLSLPVVVRLGGYYLSRIALVPYAGWALLLVPILVRDRRVWWGTASMCFFLLPFVMLPGRIFDVYTYLPLSCFSVAVGAIAGTRRPLAIPVCAAIFFSIWAVLDFEQLKIDRRAALAVGHESRAYFRDVLAFARTHPKPESIIYAGFPVGFHNWGVNGLFRCAFRDPTLEPMYVDDLKAAEAVHAPSVMIVLWDHLTRQARFLVHMPGQREPSSLTMDEETPLWLLDDGWYPLEGNNFRWMKPHATAHLQRPADARAFVLVTSTSPEPAGAGSRELRVSLDGAEIGRAKLDPEGSGTFRWPLPPGAERLVSISFDLTKGLEAEGDPRQLGMPVLSFGFR